MVAIWNTEEAFIIQRWEDYLGIIALSIFFSWRLVKAKYGWMPFLMLAFLLISACLTFLWPPMTFDLLSLRMRMVSARGFVFIVMATYFVVKFDKEKLLYFAEVFTVGNCIVYWWQGFGFFNAGSMDISMLSAIYPIMAFRPRENNLWKWVLRLLPLSCFFIHRTGSTGFVSLALSMTAYFLMTRRWKIVLPILTAIGLVGYFSIGGGRDFFSSSGRSEPWSRFMQWWIENGNMWIGTGTSTFSWLGPEIQSDRMDNIFVWMHCDWPLQILFEGGLIGLTLMTALIVICLKRSYKTPWLFASCVATVFTFTVQFPLRFLPSQIFVLLLVRLCLENDRPVKIVHKKTFSDRATELLEFGY